MATPYQSDLKPGWASHNLLTNCSAGLSAYTQPSLLVLYYDKMGSSNYGKESNGYQ